MLIEIDHPTVLDITQVASTFDLSQAARALPLAPDNGFVRLCWAAAVRAEMYSTFHA